MTVYYLDSPHKDQWRGALMFSLICAWPNVWLNNQEAGDLRRHRAHHDGTVIVVICSKVHAVIFVLRIRIIETCPNWYKAQYWLSWLYVLKYCSANVTQKWGYAGYARMLLFIYMQNSLRKSIYHLACHMLVYRNHFQGHRPKIFLQLDIALLQLWTWIIYSAACMILFVMRHCGDLLIAMNQAR